jgi:hypothetical protein
MASRLPPPRRKRLLVILVGLPLLVCVLLLIVKWGVGFWLQRDLDRELAQVKARVQPLEEALRPPRVPRDQDATPLYRQAKDRVPSRPDELYDALFKAFTRDYSPEQNLNAALWIIRSAAFYDFIQEAAARPHASPDPRSPFALTVYAGLYARYQAWSGRHDAALEWLDVGFTVLRHRHEQDVLLAYDTGQIEELGLLKSAEAIAQMAAPSLPELEAFAAFARSVEDLPDSVIPLQASAIYMLNNELTVADVRMLARMQRRDLSWQDELWLRLPYADTRLQLFRVRAAARLLDLIPEEDPHGEAHLRAVQTLQQEHRSGGLKQLVGEVIPLKVSIADGHQEAIAMRRLTQIAGHLIERRLIQGEYPAELPDGLPGDGIDPRSLKPFQYRREADGFILYSVGRNRVDDGGQEDDIAFDLRQSLPSRPRSLNDR